MKKLISGKVREVYGVGENQLAIVATDRISAFDVILESVIKDKGIALTLISYQTTSFRLTLRGCPSPTKSVLFWSRS